MTKKYNSTRTGLLLLLLAAFYLEAGGQFLTDDGNEPHAFVRARPIVVPGNAVQGDIALYPNINLTNDPLPQNEPSVRICRQNPDIVVVAWRDFRLGYLEPNIVRRIGYTCSFDGGQTWMPSMLLPDPNPNHTSQSDPVVTSDSHGHFYISSTSRQPVSGYNREMLVYKSIDSGQTFQLHAIAAPGSGLQGEDKEWLICDPVTSNPTYDRLMMAWRSFGPSYGIKFTISDAGGANWSPTVNVSGSQSGQGANVATGVEGNIYVVWRNNGIMFDVSYDGGQTFGVDKTISPYSNDNNYSFPYICVDYSETSSRGNIYVVWADARTGSDDIYFQRSADGGNTWLATPVRVNTFTAYDQYWPAIQCSESGRLFVVYYDEYEGQGAMNAYMAYSDNQGNNWTNTRLSEMSFYGYAPNSDVRFGDYISLDTYGDKVIAVWCDDRNGAYDQEIFAAVMDIQVGLDQSPVAVRASQRLQAYPNPFRERAQVSLELESPGFTEVFISDLLGNRVLTLHQGSLAQGFHRFSIEDNLASGSYICHYRQGHKTESLIISRVR